MLMLLYMYSYDLTCLFVVLTILTWTEQDACMVRLFIDMFQAMLCKMDALGLPYYKPILTTWRVFACSLTMLTWTQDTCTSLGKAFKA